MEVIGSNPIAPTSNQLVLRKLSRLRVLHLVPENSVYGNLAGLGSGSGWVQPGAGRNFYRVGRFYIASEILQAVP